MDIRYRNGDRVVSRWGQWYRHDKVIVDGKELEGGIQTKRRYYGKKIGHRFEITTFFRGSCVRGTHVDWLIGMNATPVNAQ